MWTRQFCHIRGRVKRIISGTAFLLLLCLAGFLPRAIGHRATEEPHQLGGLPSKPGLIPGAEIFDEPTVLDFNVRLAKTNLNALRQNPREYTPATVMVDGRAYMDVGVKLKGAAGSFRDVDDLPAMTLHFSKWADGRRVYGLRRLHLNNSVQDGARMSEYLGSELFRAAGVPTPRVAWATVRINDRKLGLYVLKEAFETEFLRTFFDDATGNLYDGGFLRDIDQDLNQESGRGSKDRADLKALMAAAKDPDRAKRWERLQKLLDVDCFTTYAALSVMLADWDGYLLNRNNYRIYFRPDDGRAVFMPHGMDQLFQRSHMEMDPNWTGSVAWSLFDTPQGQKLYEERCREVFTNIFRLERMTNTIARVTEVLRKVDPNIVYRASDFTDAVESRYRALLRDHIIKPPPPPVLVRASANTPSGKPREGLYPPQWRQQDGGDARMEGPLSVDGRRILKIAADGESTASWRGAIELKEGRYRFEGWVRTEGGQGGS